jgi:NtrC-family two-component system response regulator AlgB
MSVLAIDDDAGVRQSIRLCLEVEGHRVLGVGSAPAALEALDRGRFDLCFLDLWLGSDSGLAVLPDVLRRQPGIGVVMITAFATIESAVEAMRTGAADYLPKPFSPEQVRLIAHRFAAARVLQRQVSELRSRVQESDADAFFETRSKPYAGFLDRAARVAASDAVVLLRGESGTGKNVMARWIRERSQRKDQPFVTVHAPALAGELMTSTLFGHRKGAFTGAVADAPGKVEEAEHGTLFLDEVGDLNVDAQARLLRFLNDRTYERLGDTRERTADVRVVAATNRPLEDEIKAGRFREDLFYRLNVITLTPPPLRERPEDLLALAEHYLRFFAGRQNKPALHLSDSAKRAIADYAWPGNLRELRNAVERAVILSTAESLLPVDFGLPEAPGEMGPVGHDRAAVAASLGGDFSLEQIEREHVARVITRLPSMEAAARLLQIDPTTLQRKRKRYGLT